MLVLARNVASWCISYLRFLSNYSSKRRKKSEVLVLDLQASGGRVKEKKLAQGL